MEIGGRGEGLGDQDGAADLILPFQQGTVGFSGEEQLADAPDGQRIDPAQ